MQLFYCGYKKCVTLQVLTPRRVAFIGEAVKGWVHTYEKALLTLWF